MTFDARESSRLNGRPFHLYTFRVGTDREIYYTNLATEFVFGQDSQGQPITYLPLPIGHSEIVASGNLDKTTLSVRLPESGEIPDLYRDEQPSDVVALIIRQGHVADSDFKVCFTGRVLGISYEESDMVLECEPISSSLRRPGLTREYQYGCPLVLFGEQCRASKAAATMTVNPTAVDGPLVTLPANWAAADRKEKYVGGIAEWTDPAGRRARRGIVRLDGDVLTLSSAGTLAVGMTLSLTLGCNKTMDDCRDLHNNILNFGGQPAIPFVNPTGITNNYY